MQIRRWRSLLLVGSLLALSLLVSTMRVQAQAGERIREFAIEYTIERSGDVLVRERIAYDFGPEKRHGIIRDIVTRQRYDGTHDRVYGFDLESVASETAPDEVGIEEPGGGVKRLRIGDPDRTVTGEHTYVIEYRLRRALNAFEDHDEFFWNATGLQWDVPIDATSIAVHLPADALDAACYAGPSESRLSCDSVELGDGDVTFTHSSLGSFEGVTIAVALPKGMVDEPSPMLEERWSLRRAFTVDPWRLGVAGALLAAAIAGVARLAWLQGRDRRWRGQPVAANAPAEGDIEVRVPVGGSGAYPVEYMPPEGLRPGLVGTLLDETAHPLDVSATVIDLATRGYLHIEEIEGEGWFGKDDWQLQRKKPSDGLELYEQLLLDGLVPDEEPVLLSDLRGKFASKLGKVQESLYAEIVRRGWYRRSPKSTRERWLALGLVAFVASILATIAAAAFTTLAVIPLALVIAALLLLIVHPWMPARTANGTAMHRRVLGFRRFILDAETHRARFAEQAGLFYEYLPYAVVFGATEQWAKAFEGLAVPEPEWYGSHNAFTTGALIASMNNFSDRSVGSLSYTPGSSGGSGFGGGGFSGGGGGGGGGGSW